MTRASLLEKRAIIAGLAHPPILGDTAFALFSLNLSDSILRGLAGVGAAERRTEEFRVLRQGLGYAVSVFVEKVPREGFAVLQRAAAMEDKDIRWIVSENLKKKRIASRYPDDVQATLTLLSARETP